jgi:DNA-binding transcriptional regulator YiaG
MIKLDLLKYAPKEIVSDNGSVHTINVSLEGEIIPGITSNKVPKNKICLWYVRETPSKGKVYFSITIPRFIEANEDLIESVGLYLSDGSKTFCSQITFQNNEPDVINIFMKCFKNYFGVQYENWRWYINFNERLKEYESPEETREREKAAINFWLSLTPISFDSAFPTMIRYSNKKYKGKTLRSKIWGSLTISYGNTLLKNFWLNFCNQLAREVIEDENKELASCILRGWIAGDGYSRVKVYKNSLLRQIGITVIDPKERELLIKLIRLLGISFCENKKNIYFHGFNNFLISYRNDLLSLNPYKQLNLLEGLLSSQIFPSPDIKREFEKHKSELEKEKAKIKAKIKERERFFKKLKQLPLPRKSKNFEQSWSNFVRGLIIASNITPSKLAKLINSGITTLEKWLSGKNNPSTKYKVKLLSLAQKNFKLEDIENLGNMLNRIEWKYLINGILIERGIMRKDLAKIIGVHVNTIDSIINRRRPSFITIGKIFKLITWKDVERLIKLAKTAEKINWKKLVERVLNENNLTQHQLAEILKCSRSLVREWKAGNAKPTTKHQKKLLELAHYQIF